MTEQQLETLSNIQHDRCVARTLIHALGLERSYDENVVIMLETLAKIVKKELSDTPFLRSRMQQLIMNLRHDLNEDHKLLTKKLSDI